MNPESTNGTVTPERDEPGTWPGVFDHGMLRSGILRGVLRSVPLRLATLVLLVLACDTGDGAFEAERPPAAFPGDTPDSPVDSSVVVRPGDYLGMRMAELPPITPDRRVELYGCHADDGAHAGVVLERNDDGATRIARAWTVDAGADRLVPVQPARVTCAR